MDVLELMSARSSVRAFSDEPMERDLLAQILSYAAKAPSAINMQPWEVVMVMGPERKRLSKRLLRSYKERRITCSPGSVKPLRDIFIERGRQCADGMAPLIAQMGGDFKTFVNEGSLNFYGAPAVALIFIDEVFPEERMTDAGIFTAYLLLAAAVHGLGTCPIGLVKAYEDEIKDQLNIPESKRLVVSVAIGRPDPKGTVNSFKSPRVDIEEFVRWV
jgi:nitroreductase